MVFFFFSDQTPDRTVFVRQFSFHSFGAHLSHFVFVTSTLSKIKDAHCISHDIVFFLHVYRSTSAVPGYKPTGGVVLTSDKSNIFKDVEVVRQIYDKNTKPLRIGVDVG